MKRVLILFIGVCLCLSVFAKEADAQRRRTTYTGEDCASAVVGTLFWMGMATGFGISGSNAKKKREKAIERASLIEDEQLKQVAITTAMAMSDGGGRRIASWVFAILGGLSGGGTGYICSNTN